MRFEKLYFSIFGTVILFIAHHAMANSYEDHGITESKQDKLADNLPPIYIERHLKLRRHSTLTQSLAKSELPMDMVVEALHPMQRKFNLRKLQPGHEVVVRYRYDESAKNGVKYIDEIYLFSRNDKKVSVKKDGDKFKAKVEQRAVEMQEAVAVGVIENSLYESAKKAGLPISLVVPFVDLFGWEIDFTRDIRVGNEFKVVFEKIYDEEGKFIRNGKILAAQLHTQKKTYEAYMVKVGGVDGYYDAQGFNKRRALLRTPLVFSRISSHFNPSRKHPILGYTRAHKGTDFAAPSGTAIKASGDGVIEKLGWNGGYGRYIRIRHDSKYQSAYAHMRRYARGMREGKKVK